MADMLETIADFRNSELDALRVFRKRGGKAGAYFCRFFPPEILAGLGLWPIRIVSGISRELEAAAERVVRPDVCPYCKMLLGGFLKKSGLQAESDIAIGLFTCDMMRRIVERISSDAGIPVFALQLPATRTPSSEKYWVSQVARVVSDMEIHLGVTFDPVEAFRDAARRMHLRRLLSKFMETGNIPPVLMHRLSHLINFTRPDKFADFLSEYSDRIPLHPPAKKILLVGSAALEEDEVIFDTFERKGIGVVNYSCTGIPSMEIELKPGTASSGRVLEELAAAAFRQPPCIRHRPNAELYDRLKSALKTRGCSGVILNTLKFCDLWFTEKVRMEEELGVPILVLDRSFADSETERLKNRLDAFAETLR
jgi:benzoyl-CoA reductase/2-hydroxyglutaryl-CoA dehydratase subunit BcrC/BadD/HgdB